MNLNCYTLIGGQFIGPDYTAAPVPVVDKNTGEPILDRAGKPVTKLPSKTWNMGETVVSPHDLAARPGNVFTFKGPYTPKGGSPATTATVVPPSATVPASDPFYTEAELNEMTVADLTNLASEEEIDLGGATKKADIVKALLAAKS